MILTINGGSSSIKFALFDASHSLQQVLVGALENIGVDTTIFNFNKVGIQIKNNISVAAANHDQAAIFLIDWLKDQDGFNAITAIGHRIVHGMQYTGPEMITPGLLNELRQICSYDPEHLPGEIELIELFQKHWPALKQVACFDTSFHSTMPQVAKMLAIPLRYFNKGIRRYGFHGLSYAYLLEELEHISGKKTADGKIILAHLGSGASLVAVKDGKSLDTTMGFTPASGLPMSTRSGDIDPGIAWYLMQHEKLNPKQFNHFINHGSGLLGMSEISGDMRELIDLQYKDSRAAQAIELFCYQTKKSIGSFAAILGGLETLVFTGGIGENSPEVRSKICHELAFLGIEIDERKNINNDTIISASASNVMVHVIKTNEELMIARLTNEFLQNNASKWYGLAGLGKEKE